MHTDFYRQPQIDHVFHMYGNALWVARRPDFFFSSRRRHTRFDCDWSSDVCSSDLDAPVEEPPTGSAMKAATESGPSCRMAASNAAPLHAGHSGSRPPQAQRYG